MSTAAAAPAKRPRTEAQIAASRANGAKSRGPKTAAGKRRSSQNACKHGFYTKRGPTISRRRARRVKDDYQKRLRKYTECFKPQTPYETELVVLLAYTRERVWFFRELETRTFNQALLDHRAEIEEMRPKLRKGMLLHHELAIVFPYIRTQIVLINNYERRYLRIWRRILWELLRIQFANLRNEPAKPPAESMLLQLLSPDKPVPLARPQSPQKQAQNSPQASGSIPAPKAPPVHTAAISPSLRDPAPKICCKPARNAAHRRATSHERPSTPG